MKGVTHMENFNLETLEKGIKKRSRIRNQSIAELEAQIAELKGN